MVSFNATVTDYEHDLAEQKQSGHPGIANDNFDTGTVTGPGEYPLADETYAELVDRLAKDHFAHVTPELRSAILDFYKDPNAPLATRKHKKEWAKVTQEVSDLKATAPNAGPTPSAPGF